MLRARSELVGQFVKKLQILGGIKAISIIVEVGHVVINYAHVVAIIVLLDQGFGHSGLVTVHFTDR